MALAWVDFLHINDAPFAATTVPGAAPPSVDIRVLNADPATGAITVAARCAPGWQLDAGRVHADLEVFTLAGSARYGDDAIGRYCYAFLPADSPTAPVTVGPDGLTVLLFADSTPGFAPSESMADAGDGGSGDRGAPTGTRDPAAGQIGPVHIADVPWEQPRTPAFPAGAGRKTLRDDTGSGRAFWILAVLPHWRSPKTEWHTFDEENVVLEGEIQSAAGLMQAGGYLAHPSGPDTVHGPMRSRTGALMITRAGGPLGTTYAPAKQQLTGPWW